MLQDISLDQSRQQRDRSAHRLASRVLAISSDAVIITDPDLHIRTANVSAEKMFGYGSGELTGLHLNALLPERYRGQHAGQISQFASEPQPARLMGERAEVVGLTRSGTEIPLEASIGKVTLDTEVIFSAQLRDLSASKLAAQQLARTRASLQTVFDHALQAMALIDVDGSVLEMNAAARQLLPAGTDPRGKDFATLPFFSTDSATTEDQLKDAISRCLAGTSYRITTSIDLPTEGTRELDFSLTPVMDDVTVFAIVAEARDLLERGAAPGA
jgi:PAS domain S-box-containing protein